MTFLGLPWDCLAILLALAILPPLRGTARVRRFLARPEISAADRAKMYRSTIAFQWLATAIVAWRMYADRWSLAELGSALGRPLRTVIAAAVLVILLAAIQMGGLLYFAWARSPAARRGVSYEMMRKLMPQSNAELPIFLPLLVTVSLCEEFLYRGFALAAFSRAFPDSISAVVLAAAILFAIGHAYQGRQGAVSTFLLALIFGTVRMWTGSLVPGIVAHFTIDAIAGILGPRAVHRGLAQDAAAEASTGEEEPAAR